MDFSLNRAEILGRRIEAYYRYYKVNIRVTKVKLIPELRRYIFNIKILPGVKVQNIFDCATDIQMALRFDLFYPFQEQKSIYLAVSETSAKENGLIKILLSQKFAYNDMQIPLALGYDLQGGMYITDLVKLVHLLIIGPSGTGKSVALRCIVMSIIVTCPINSVRLVLFDIGANSLSIFGEVKHLYCPIVKDIETGIAVLESLVKMMNERLLLEEDDCKKQPFCVCIIDEFDDAISGIDDTKKTKQFIDSINSIIRRGRKAKIILILASHDPTVKNTRVNINGIISRIAFKCANHHKSLTALGVTGAERLSGEGAMLLKAQGEGIPIPLQGSYVSSEEIDAVLSTVPAGNENVDFLEVHEATNTNNTEWKATDVFVGRETKEMANIILWVLGQTQVSVNKLKSRFQMGNRATTIMESLCDLGIVSPKCFNQPRKVIPICSEELSDDVISILNQCGYTWEQIKKVFEGKLRCIDEQV
jgi:S-DNA-T family DNA segregation ATPase FtsK/SpoIIIE